MYLPYGLGTIGPSTDGGLRFSSVFFEVKLDICGEGVLGCGDIGCVGVGVYWAGAS